MRYFSNIRPVSTAVVLLVLSAFAAPTACGQEARGAPLPDELMAQIESRQYAAALPQLVKLADAGNHAAEFLLGNYYTCGKVVEFDCGKAHTLFGAAARPSQSPISDEIVRRSKNELAWINATCEQPGFKRDIHLALKYAKEASRDGDPYGIDSLAAAWAAYGDFDAAVKAQQRAIEGLLADANHDGVNSRTVDQFRERLALYKAKKPARSGKWNADANCNALP